jgi:hypothetical protein
MPVGRRTPGCELTTLVVSLECEPLLTGAESAVDESGAAAGGSEASLAFSLPAVPISARTFCDCEGEEPEAGAVDELEEPELDEVELELDELELDELELDVDDELDESELELEVVEESSSLESSCCWTAESLASFSCWRAESLTLS